MNEEVTKIAASPDMRTLFLGNAQRVVTGTPEQLAALLRQDWTYYGKLVKTLDLKLE